MSAPDRMGDGSTAGTVAVAVATMWTKPDAVRPVDAAALDRSPDPAAWVSAMGPAGRADLDGRSLTQLLLGEPVTVLESVDGWCRVIAPNQPSGADRRGYPGWVAAAHLAPTGVPEPDHVVDALFTGLRDAPGGAVVIAGVPLGTGLAAAGPAEGGWLPVTVPDHSRPLWTDGAVPGPVAAPTGAALVDVARRFLGLPYVWGGLSGAGTDCSGLVHLTARRLGLLVPRDAADQADALAPVDLGTERTGDVYVFARPGRRVHHIGFVVSPGVMVHACGTRGEVVEEPVTGEREATLVGARRL